MLTTQRMAALKQVAKGRCAEADPAHDFGHVQRVARTAQTLAQAQGADVDIAVAAALLHELFSYPKGHPESHRSGEVCAQHARQVLQEQGCPQDIRERICECIRAHAFSSGKRPPSLEAAVLQDADRLDAIGAVGIARCFATCASMRRPLVSPDDPFCRRRDPDDTRWGLDHFYRKLLRVEAGLHTKAAREMAQGRAAFLRAYLEQLEREIGSGE